MRLRALEEREPPRKYFFSRYFGKLAAPPWANDFEPWENHTPKNHVVQWSIAIVQ